MKKRYGIDNHTIKMISCLLTIVLLFGLIISFHSVAEANQTVVQGDENEDLTTPVDIDGDGLDATPDNSDESDNAVEPDGEISEDPDGINAPVEQPEGEPGEAQKLEKPAGQNVQGDEETPRIVERNSEDTDELAEYYPSVLEDPITLPSYYFQNSLPKLMSTGLQDTIDVYKTAERTKDTGGNLTGCRTFEVTLGITGTPQAAPVDVVLVLDRSGSMDKTTGSSNYGYNKIAQAPSNNGSYFVKVGGSYQSITLYSGSGANRVWRYNIGTSWNPVWRYVKWDFNGNDSAAGSTGNNFNNATPKPFYVRGNTRLHHAKEAAINFAAKVLGPDGIPGSRVSVVSYSGPSTISGNGNQNQASTDRELTDNLSQVVNAINGLNAVGGTNTQAGFLQGKRVIENSNNPNSNKVVIMFTDGLPTASNGNRYAETTDSNHIHVTSAIAAGKSIFQNNIADVFTIGLLQGMSGDELTLARYILDQTQNKGFYEAPTAQDLNTIFADISEKLAYSARNAVVVDKIGDNFDLVSSLPDGATYNSATHEITWSPGTIVEEAELKYIIQAKPGFEGGSANTNEYAKLTYTDVFGASGKEKVFPVPNVDVPTKLTVSLTDATILSGESISLGAGTDPSGENYMSAITGGDGDRSTYTYEWRIKGSSVFSTEKNPTVIPQDNTIYELTVTDSNGCKAIAEMKVTVLKTVDVTIKKEVTGNFSDRSREFSFTVTINEDDTHTFNLLHEGEYILENIPIDAVITLKETNVNGYEVTVTVPGIDDPIQPDGKGIYTINVAEMDNEKVITVTNHKEVNIDTGISLDSLPYLIILALVIAGIAIILIRKHRINSED